jgi:hypothetical protein
MAEACLLFNLQGDPSQMTDAIGDVRDAGDASRERSAVLVVPNRGGCSLNLPTLPARRHPAKQERLDSRRSSLRSQSHPSSKAMFAVSKRGDSSGLLSGNFDRYVANSLDTHLFHTENQPSFPERIACAFGVFGEGPMSCADHVLCQALDRIERKRLENPTSPGCRDAFFDFVESGSRCAHHGCRRAFVPLPFPSKS